MSRSRMEMEAARRLFLWPLKADRYKILSTAERANSRLKDGFGANYAMVKRHRKAALHLMFGVALSDF